MSLTQKIQNALSAAGLSTNNFTLSTPDQVGGVIVKSRTDNYDEVVSAQNALEAALPASEYFVMFARSITDPNLYVRSRPAGL